MTTHSITTNYAILDSGFKYQETLQQIEQIQNIEKTIKKYELARFILDAVHIENKYFNFSLPIGNFTAERVYIKAQVVTDTKELFVSYDNYEQWPDELKQSLQPLLAYLTAHPEFKNLYQVFDMLECIQRMTY